MATLLQSKAFYLHPGSVGREQAKSKNRPISAPFLVKRPSSRQDIPALFDFSMGFGEEVLAEFAFALLPITSRFSLTRLPA
jgi:hypothetical protein